MTCSLSQKMLNTPMMLFNKVTRFPLRSRASSLRKAATTAYGGLATCAMNLRDYEAVRDSPSKEHSSAKTLQALTEPLLIRIIIFNHSKHFLVIYLVISNEGSSR